MHALAHFVLRGDLDRGAALLAGTLDIIERNLPGEAADPAAKWHLADLALVGLLRAWSPLTVTRSSGKLRASRAARDRLRREALGFRWHYGRI